jgi:uncharacterized membrane protein HdeD (DUF308 family)
MNKYLGIGLLAVGVVLILFGLDAKDSLSSRISEFFGGAPTDKTVWLLILGVLAAVVGVGALLRPGRTSSTT